MRTSSVVMDHVTHMKLEIVGVTMKDVQYQYRCIARNSLGETDGRIKLYGKFTLHITKPLIIQSKYL